MLAALALLLGQLAPPPPPGFGEPLSPGPYLVFFADGRDNLPSEGMEILARVKRDLKILPGIRAVLCLPVGDTRERRRRAVVERAIGGTKNKPRLLAREGRNCIINAGSRRAAGFIAYQIDLVPADWHWPRP